MGGCIIKGRDTNRVADRFTRAGEKERLSSPQIIQPTNSVRPNSDGSFKWIKLSDASSNPMTGKEATFNGSSWDTSGDDISVYVYPQIDLTQYHDNDKVLAMNSGGYWVALYNTPAAFDEY